jgi:short-chain fatty acids transporter
MGITTTIESFFKKVLPSPFVITVLLTLLTIFIAFFFTEAPTKKNHFLTILSYWESGIWNNNLLVFAYQMMLILVLGHILVLSKPLDALIMKLTSGVTNTGNAFLLVSVATLLVSFFNWGLGLIFVAILARKVARSAQLRGFKINCLLVGASGYVGLMIWHGGISGSVPLKVAERVHLASLMSVVSTPELIAQVPDSIAFDQTVSSSFNLMLFSILLILIPAVLYFIGKRVGVTPANLSVYKNPIQTTQNASGTEKLDTSNILGIGFGTLVLAAFFYQYFNAIGSLAITPNLLNFFVLGLALVLHKNFASFLSAHFEAIKGASGILIQFPLYFGIMGIMKKSGRVVQISDFFVSIATTRTLPILTSFSAGLVNIFVPSDGGQSAIQGPIVIESALKLGVPLPKMILALSYGDQITNMLQPFWALPLLGITQLKAREILPYILVLMLVGVFVFVTGLLLF